MKQTVQINIGHRLFNIDVDAYQELSKYLKSLTQYFGNNAEGDEIVEDIETRISDLFSERKNANHSISIDDVNAIIQTMGSPEDMQRDQIVTDDEAAPEPLGPKKLVRIKEGAKIEGVCMGIADYLNIDVTLVRVIFVLLAMGSFGTWVAVYIILWMVLPVGEPSPWSAPKQKLYRDPQDKVLGGVLSGIAEYFGYNSNNVRVSFMIPYLLLGLTILTGPLFFITAPLLTPIVSVITIIYILLWIFLPPATTPIDRMELKGEPINVSTITESNTYNADSGQNMSSRNTRNSAETSNSLDQNSGCLRILGIILKVTAMGLMVLSLIVLLIGLFAYFSSGLDFSSLQSYIFDSAGQNSLFYLSIITLFVAPILLLMYFILKSRDPQNKKLVTLAYASLGLWLFAIFSLSGIASSIGSDFRTKVSKEDESFLKATSDTLFIKYRNKGDYKIEYGTSLEDFVFAKDDRLYVNIGDDVDVERSTAKEDFKLIVYKSAFGGNADKAESRIENISYRTELHEDTLFVDRYLSIPKGQKYRGQHIKLDIIAPKGKTVISENNGIHIDFNNGQVRIKTNNKSNRGGSVDVNGPNVDIHIDDDAVDVQTGDQDIYIDETEGIDIEY